ncbi:hypothetical protein ACFLQJ_02595 [Calditrichota bacterium]
MHIRNDRFIKWFLVILCLLLVNLPDYLNAQVADNIENLEILQLIHTPNAGVLHRGQYQFDFRGYGDSGVNIGLSIGLFDRFMFGVSYGGNKILGYEQPDWNSLPGVLVKYRLIEETQLLPALTAGFDMQGRGAWNEDDERYLFKAPGVFAAVSRNFISTFGRFGVHGGANYNSIEDKNGDNAWDAFAGIDYSINEQIIVLGEYDFAFDDNEEDGTYGKGRGYLNLGVRLALAQSFILEFDAIDVLLNSESLSGESTIGREVKIVYVETFDF